MKATGPYFLFGILLSALFRRYVPQDLMTKVFGGNEAWGVLMAATVGVPLYACGGGTIPLLQQWLWDGMSMGSAAAFMITGPATKITNLGALKIAMGWKRFALYILFIMLFSFLCGMIVNLVMYPQWIREGSENSEARKPGIQDGFGQQSGSTVSKPPRS